MLWSTARIWGRPWTWWSSYSPVPLSKTRGEINSMIVWSSLVEWQFYKITDPWDWGTITVPAIASDKLGTKGVWTKTHKYKAWGYITLSGDTWDVTALNVWGVDQLSYPVSFLVDRQSFLESIVDSINANPSRIVNATYQLAQWGYSSGRIVLEHINGWVNTQAVSATLTGSLSARNIWNLAFGLADQELDIEVDYVMYLLGNSEAWSRIVRAYHAETDAEVIATAQNFVNWFTSAISWVKADWSEGLWCFKWGKYTNCKLIDTAFYEVFLRSTSSLQWSIFERGTIEKVSFTGTQAMLYNQSKWSVISNVFGGNLWILWNVFEENTGLIQTDIQTTTFSSNYLKRDCTVSIIQSRWTGVSKFWNNTVGRNAYFIQTIRNNTTIENANFGEWYQHSIDIAGELNISNLRRWKTSYPLGADVWLNLYSDNADVVWSIKGFYEWDCSMNIQNIGGSGAGEFNINSKFMSNSIFEIYWQWNNLEFTPEEYVKSHFNITNTNTDVFIKKWVFRDVWDRLQVNTDSLFSINECHIESPDLDFFPSSLSGQDIVWDKITLKNRAFEKRFVFNFDGNVGFGNTGDPCLLGNAMRNTYITALSLYGQNLVYGWWAALYLWFASAYDAYTNWPSPADYDWKHYEPAWNSVNILNQICNNENFIFTPLWNNITAGTMQGILKWFIS